MVDNDIKEMLANALFTDPTFEGAWMEIKQEYESLGFQDDISDAEMIDEFKYIAQQMRKYKFSHQDQILAYDSYEDMASEVEALIGKAKEYGDCRKEIVYNFLRDQWLYNLYNAFVRMAQANSANIYEDYEEDDDA